MVVRNTENWRLWYLETAQGPRTKYINHTHLRKQKNVLVRETLLTRNLAIQEQLILYLFLFSVIVTGQKGSQQHMT